MTAILLDNLGGLYAANQQYSLAEATYLQAISVNVLIYKSNSAEVASAFRRLGELYELSGRVTDAEQAYRKSITIFKQSSEPRKHAHVVGLLASMLIDGGRSTEAYSLYADALALDGSLIYKKYSAPVVAAAGFEIPPPNTDQNSAPTINTSKLSRVEPKEPGLYDAVEIYYGTDRKIVQKTENGDSYDLYGSERNGSLQLG